MHHLRVTVCFRVRILGPWERYAQRLKPWITVAKGRILVTSIGSVSPNPADGTAELAVCAARPA